jgi:hypothetical protein
MRSIHVIPAALLVGAACLSIAACDPVTFHTANGGSGSISCPDAPTSAPNSAAHGSCTWNYTPGSAAPSTGATVPPSSPASNPAPTTKPSAPTAPSAPTKPVATTSATPPPAAPPAAPPAGSLPAGQFPNASNTGVPAGTQLTTRSGDVRLGAGQSLINVHVTGSVYITGSGAVIKNSQVDGGINNISAPQNSFTVTDTTIGPATGCKDAAPEAGLEAGNFTATRVQIRNYNHAVQPEAANAVVTDSFMKVCSQGADHADGVIAYKSGANVKILRNTIDMSGVPKANQTAPVFNTGSQVPSFDIENNLLLGGSYSVRIYNDNAAPGGYAFKNNSVVQGSWLYGAVDSDCSVLAPWSPSNANGNTLVKVDSNYKVTSTVGPLYCTNTR